MLSEIRREPLRGFLLRPALQRAGDAQIVGHNLIWRESRSAHGWTVAPESTDCNTRFVYLSTVQLDCESTAMQTHTPLSQTSLPPLRAVREAHGLGLREV